MNNILSQIAGIVWNYPVVFLCLLSGAFYTIRLGFVQLRTFPHAIALIMGRYDKKDEEGHISHFQALSAALSGTIGIGNISGVAIAIAMGGPGAVFWMWIVGLLGMATKFAECTLGTYYRDQGSLEVRGGPMYYISKGLGKKGKFLSYFYAICMAVGAFGVGAMFQANQAAIGLSNEFGLSKTVAGLILAGLVFSVTVGGISRIGKFAARIVPFMCLVYITGALAICFYNFDKIPAAFSIILTDAFSGEAVLGGAFGQLVMIGVRRALFSNEAGLGSATIAHAAVKTNYPVREGIVASLGPFIDTIVVCTATALVIILSGSYGGHRYEENFKSALYAHNTNQDHFQNFTKVSSFPKDEDPLRSFYQGQQVLSANSNFQDSSKIDITTLIKEEGLDGIRLSLYHSSGEQILQLIDDKNTVLFQRPLNSTTDIDNRLSSKLTPILTGYDKLNKWHSRLIELPKGVQNKLQQSNKIYLNFITQKTKLFYLGSVLTIKELNGIGLTSATFEKYFKGFGHLFITIAAILFAFSTIVTWTYYGETASVFLLGNKSKVPYRMAFVLATFVGSIVGLETILNFSDIMVGIMVIPNSIGILLLHKVVVRETKKYLGQLHSGEFSEKEIPEEGIPEEGIEIKV